MHPSRRKLLKASAATVSGLALSGLLPPSRLALAAEADSYPAAGGNITIHPVSHASFVMETPDVVVYVDPVGGAEAYADLPAPQLILITHEHGDHYDEPTLSALVGDDTVLVTNPAVYDMLPEALRSKASAIANGESTESLGLPLEAVPAYNLTEERLNFHPKGRDNGYIVTVGDKRVYIAGDTEATPEMRALSDIDIAFVPMNLPYTMAIEQAADGVTEFAPAVVYPYHYRGGDDVYSDTQAFADLVAEQNGDIQVVLQDWYA